jgi:hypothetical protein
MHSSKSDLGFWLHSQCPFFFSVAYLCSINCQRSSHMPKVVNTLLYLKWFSLKCCLKKTIFKDPFPYTEKKVLVYFKKINKMFWNYSAFLEAIHTFWMLGNTIPWIYRKWFWTIYIYRWWCEMLKYNLDTDLQSYFHYHIFI